jgi:uncharacterized protein (DUF1330 family)
MPTEGLVYVLIARIPTDGIAAFNDYESKVLPLLANHGGVLQRRLRTDDGGTEVHLVWFPSEAHFQSYRNDPERARHTALLTTSQASTELLRTRDVGPGQ